MSSSLQVINEIIYCLLLGFCQNTGKKKKKEKKSHTKKHNSYCQQNPLLRCGPAMLSAMPSENTVCSDPVHSLDCSQHSSDTCMEMTVTNRPLCKAARSSRAALHKHRAMVHTALCSQRNPTDEWGRSSNPKECKGCTECTALHSAAAADGDPSSQNSRGKQSSVERDNSQPAKQQI